jgi:hypothetical protein
MRARSTIPPPSLDWALGEEIGALKANNRTQDRRLERLEQRDEQRKSDLDRLRTNVERGAILLVLYAAGIGLHMAAPFAGPLLGALLRWALGVRPG